MASVGEDGMTPRRASSISLPSRTSSFPLPSPGSSLFHPPPDLWNKYVIGCTVLASLTSILLGYDIAVLSGAGSFIKDELGIDDTKLEILVGIINICSLFGSIAASRMADWIGRRLTIVFAAAIFFFGALTMALAPSYSFLMAGRFIAGIGVGYALVIAPVYVAEVAPASSRGFLTSLPEIFINFGILLSYVSNLVFAGLPARIGWRLMFAAGAVPPVFIALGVLAMPESPRWLVLQGRAHEARQVLSRTSDTPEEVEIRLAEIREAAGVISMGSSGDVAMPLLARPSRRKGSEGTWADLFVHPTPAVRRVLLAAIGVQFFQQASGIDCVVLYSPRVFEKAGLKGSLGLAATVAVGFVKTMFIVVAMVLSDRIGRRPLLLASAGGMFVSLLGMGYGLLTIDGRPEAAWAATLCVAAVAVFVASFSVGLGPIAWVYSSEVFPLKLRAHGASVAAVTNRVTSAAVAMTFISLYKAITIAGSFFLYAGVAAAAVVFIYFFLPETRGRNLEDMDSLFGGSKEEETDAAISSVCEETSIWEDQEEER